MTNPPAEESIARARAAMASKRANLCRHGVAVCHECERHAEAKSQTGESREEAQ